ncbi:MAG: hypothetical protein CMO81_07300 [Waddliaceae bacterium]|nr:hypothetical protein [Waddliaceae bacterium]
MSSITASSPITLASKTEEQDLGVNIVQKCWQAHRSAWAYTGKLIVVSRHTMNAIVRICSVCQKILCPAIWALKVSAFVGLTNSIVSLPSTLKSYGKSVRLGDIEGIALGTLGLIMSGLDIFDDATGVAGFIAHFSGVTALGALGFLGLPVIISLVGLGVVSRSYKAGARGKFAWDLQQTLKSKDPQALKQFTEAYLPSNVDEKTQAVFEARLQRRANPKIVELMKDLQKIQEEGSGGVDLKERTVKLLSCQEKQLWKALAANIAYIGFSAGVLSGFGLFYASGIASWVPFAVLATTMTARLGVQAYEDFFLPRMKCAFSE